MKSITAFFCLSLIILTQASCSQPVRPASAVDRQSVYRPSAEAMILDGLVYRPLALAGTIVGTGIFVITLPFSMLGGNVDEARETLVIEPAQDTFARCLGCIDAHGFDNRR